MPKFFRFSIHCVIATIIGLLLVAAVNATPVFINEIHYDNAGSDQNEGFEIAGPANTDLLGWQLVLYNGSNGQPYSSKVLAGVIANLADGFGVLSFAYSGIQNGAPDGVALIDHADQLVQFLSYEGAFTAVSGAASGQTSVDILVHEPSNTIIGSSLQLFGVGSEYEDFQWRESTAQSFGAVNSGQQFLAAVESVPAPSSLALCLFALLIPWFGTRLRNQPRAISA